MQQLLAALGRASVWRAISRLLGCNVPWLQWDATHRLPCHAMPGQASSHCNCGAPRRAALQAGLTPDELLLEATRAWNVAVRQRPQDEELWLEFAAFQHFAAQQQQPRGRWVLGRGQRSATASILAAAVEQKQLAAGVIGCH